MAAALAISLTPLGLATSTSAATSTGAGIAALRAAKPDPTDAYKDKTAKVKEKQEKKIDQADRDAAAARALQQGALNPLMMVEAAAAPILDNGVQVPRYFSHPNYANSPLPTVESTSGTQVFVGNELLVRSTATDSATNVFVVLPQHPLPAGMLQSFQIRSQVDPPRDFHAYVLRPTQNTNEYSVVFDSGTLNATNATVVDGIATFPVANLAVQAGDVLAFYGSGIPIDIGSGTDQVHYPSPSGPTENSTITVGTAPFPTLAQPRTYSFGAQVLDTSTQSTVITGGIKKFVDPLPDLAVAVPDATEPYPGSDFYRIGLVEYNQ
ncbi:MAG: hypothetical protein WCA30_09940, partial [Dermatophilaceae bacterium]